MSMVFDADPPYVEPCAKSEEQFLRDQVATHALRICGLLAEINTLKDHQEAAEADLKAARRQTEEAHKEISRLRTHLIALAHEHNKLGELILNPPMEASKLVEKEPERGNSEDP